MAGGFAMRLKVFPNRKSLSGNSLERRFARPDTFRHCRWQDCRLKFVALFTRVNFFEAETGNILVGFVSKQVAPGDIQKNKMAAGRIDHADEIGRGLENFKQLKTNFLGAPAS